MPRAVLQQFEQRLSFIYQNEGLADTDIAYLADKILKRCQRSDRYFNPRTYPTATADSDQRWNQDDVILITYGNSIQNRQNEEKPLETLNNFLRSQLAETVNCVHILPFFPYSSDDGFSVIDYRQVNPEWGDWSHIEAISRQFDLMSDLVINHCSRESLWFIDFIGARKPYCDYFMETSPELDLSAVTRPRNTPLLSPVHTHNGIKHVWATFSDDQIDLNFSNPDVLLEFIDIFLLYIEKGARFIRLDAIAFLWKQTGTTCVHLPQTHEVVKLLRNIVDYVDRKVIVITETNVPVKENLSYFGESDEAHMVYQFGLPPLLLHALNRGNSSFLTEWALNIPQLPQDCTYLNFTASHDGIGVRPVEELLPVREVQDLIDCMHRFGGFVSTKTNSDGSESPYEINISLFDACMGTRRGADHFQVQRFICSQAIMLAMQGIPAIYIHSLIATPNDLAHVEQTGRTRSINRKIWQQDELQCLLENPITPQAEVFNELKRLIKIRRQQEAFHPQARQQVIKINSDMFILKRTSVDKSQVIYAISNVTERILTLPMETLVFLPHGLMDLLQKNYYVDDVLLLSPYQSVWLTT